MLFRSDDMKAKEQQWYKEKGELIKEEKKKLEYQLFDVWKANNANKDKIERMKKICDE